MILDFDLADASERPVNAYNAPGSINTNLTTSAPCAAFWRFMSGLDVLIVI